ncbi:MAG: hypothetical protein K6E47_14600 [Lachnospiraceae bacterium]|nr:hypothetical protein [Lachnospiraceae bacterium]
MLQMISGREKCIFCNSKAEKSFSISNRLFWMCGRCELLVSMLTYGIDRDCVKEGESVDEADLPFYEEGKMCAGVPVDALLPFDDLPVRDDPSIIEELIPFDNAQVNVVSVRKKSGTARKKKRKGKAAHRQ